MKRRTMLFAVGASGVAVGLGAGCSRGPIGRQPISVVSVQPRDTTGLRWVADGIGGVSHSEPELVVDEGDEVVTLSMTAWNAARPNENQIAIGLGMPVEFALAAPLGTRRFVDDHGVTLVQRLT